MFSQVPSADTAAFAGEAGDSADVTTSLPAGETPLSNESVEDDAPGR